MNQELENIDLDNNPNEAKKRPTFLTILLVLSTLYIVSGFFGATQALISGPLSPEQMEEQMSELYGTISGMVENDPDGQFSNTVEVMIDNSVYLNNEAFYSSNILNLVSFIIGGMAIFMMFKLNKIGFHLYVIYSLLPVVITYAIVPMSLILPMTIVMLVLLGAIFSVLYGIHLKYMK
ncbi:hypothetical protein [Brumimicrobium mesophilum]|uniref:hypothetical protein n=1 Tax=Brumimicrobium mesophilum TaxID=392717 RepID=UPI000D13EF18|nr:hypothetical protein [Brumimicrobium mesophilum]